MATIEQQAIELPRLPHVLADMPIVVGWTPVDDPLEPAPRAPGEGGAGFVHRVPRQVPSEAHAILLRASLLCGFTDEVGINATLRLVSDGCEYEITGRPRRVWTSIGTTLWMPMPSDRMVHAATEFSATEPEHDVLIQVIGWHRPPSSIEAPLRRGA